jgi:uncharacterized protein (TIGR02302 family)
MPQSDPTPRRPGLERRLVLARLALVWERAWPALWPALEVAGAFLALALFDLPAQLPPLLHLLLLAAFTGLLVAALIFGFRSFSVPDRNDARRRIETASGLAHRPLATLEDKLMGGAGDPASQALWQIHRARMDEEARRLRIGTPAAGLLRRDPYALRVALGLALLLGAIDAGSDWSERIRDSFSPSFAPAAPGVGVALDIWVSPPDYTGLPPQFLAATTPQPVAVPIGSALLAQVHGGSDVPQLVLDGKPTDFTRIDDSNYKGNATLTAGKTLAVTQDGRTLGQWPIAIVPDLPPTIAFAKPPTHTDRGVLRLEYNASDDYGVERVTALIRRKDKPAAEALKLDLPLPSLHPKQASAASYHDLTPHPWAGLPVVIQLQATDAIGQTGMSETVETVLPERAFHNPVARAIIEARKDLTLDPDDPQPVAETLSDLSLRPSLFGNDVVVFLALRSAQARLEMNQDPDTVPAVQQLLWETALRIEDGRATTSQNDLRQAMQRLQDALARNAPDAEIDRLTAELQQAIDRYLQALAQQLQNQPPGQPMQPIDPSRMLSRQDLQRMLDRARDLAHTGSREQAMNLLQQLQQMLENLRMARPGEMMGGQNQAMQQMNEMLQRQQQLLDRSFRRSQQGNQQGDQSQDDANEQEMLRQMLGDMMQKLGEQGGDLPAPMARADRAMRNAVEALRQSQSGQAIGSQTEALDALQQAARAMAQQMMGRNGRNGEGNDPGDDGASDQARRDPFGRMTDENGNGGLDDGGLMRMGKAPSDYALEKAKQILEELRQRAGERDRPEIEHDYIDRLLKQF